MMDFGTAIKTGFRKYAEFQGTATRSEFWWFILFVTLVGGGTGALWNGLSVAWGFAVLLPVLAVSIRRLRDAGYSWGMVFIGLIPLVGPIILAILYSQPTYQGPQKAEPESP